MKTDLQIAIKALSGDKNLPEEVVFEAVEAALASAYKKDSAPTATIEVKVDRETGDVHVFTVKAVVEEVTDPETETTLADARRLDRGAHLGGEIRIEATPQNAGRIAAQTAKQVVLQKLREAEREVVYEEFAAKEGDIVSGIVTRVDPRQVLIDLGKNTEAVMLSAEQVRNEHYRQGQRIKVYLLHVNRTPRGPQIEVSRAHKNLIKRLFELEVPEIFKGLVEIKSIAREPGYRSKVAVWARQEGIDPVGACVGLRGIRIQNIVNELNGERIDVVQWDPEPARFVANALSPAQVVSVGLDADETTAGVVVPDRQLSLAIGKEGQNARLAAKLTNLRIDIKSQTAAEAERLAAMPAEVSVAVEAELRGEIEAIAAPGREAAEPLEAMVARAEPVAAAAETPVQERVAAAPPPMVAAPPEPKKIRFAEDLLGTSRPSEARGKKVKGGRRETVDEEGDARVKAAKAKKGKQRPVADYVEEELDVLEEFSGRIH